MTTSGGFASYFGSELRRLREHMGWRREDLAERLPWSVWTITSVEQGRRKPPPGLGEHTDAIFGLPEVLTNLSEKARDDRTSFGDLVDFEQRATSVGVFDMRLVPGLLQTVEYVRAVNRGLSSEELERTVQIRMQRQRILEGERPPALHAIVDEAVLCRRIGDSETMHDQLVALASPRHNVTVQILPFHSGTHDSVGGPLTILSLPDEPDVAYADGWAGGHVVDTPAQVFQAQQAFQQLAALALPPDMSAEMIKAYAEDS